MSEKIFVSKDRNTYANYEVYVDRVRYDVTETIRRGTSKMEISRKIYGDEYLMVMNAVDKFKDEEKEE